MIAPTPGAHPPDAPCPCGHTTGEHDGLAARYCLATAKGALDRDCICVMWVPAPALVSR